MRTRQMESSCSLTFQDTTALLQSFWCSPQWYQPIKSSSTEMPAIVWNYTWTLLPEKWLLKLPPLVPVIWMLWAGEEVVLLPTSPSWGSGSWQDPVLPLLPQLQWGLEFPGVGRFKPSLHKSHWKNSHLPLSLLSWAVHEAPAPEFTEPIRPVLPWPSARVALGRSWGCWGYPALPAGQWVLVLLPSMTKSLIKQPGLWTQTCSVSYLVHGKCVWVCVWTHHGFPPSVSLTPPTLTFPPPPYKAFRVSPKALYPPVCSKT